MNETVDLIKTILKNSKAKEVELIEIYNREPKVICNKTKDFIKLVTEVSTENNIPINWKDTGGVCDGNILQMKDYRQSIHLRKWRLSIPTMSI